MWLQVYLDIFLLGLSYRRPRAVTHTVLPGVQSTCNFIRASVPQGSMLGQLLILLFINDIVTDTRQVAIPMDTNCAILVANLFLFCYERNFLTTLFYDKQASIIVAFMDIYRV